MRSPGPTVARRRSTTTVASSWGNEITGIGDDGGEEYLQVGYTREGGGGGGGGEIH